MLFHFGFILVMAAAANGQDWYRKFRFTTPRAPTYATTSSLPGPQNNYDPSVTKREGETVIFGWEPKITASPSRLDGNYDETGTNMNYGQLQSNSTGSQNRGLGGLGSNVAQLSHDWDFKCPKRYSFYRYEQNCDIYVECRNFQPFRKVCPDGMHFKESPRWSEYPCAYPPEAQCLSREFALPARPTAECPRQFGNYPIAVERYPTHDRCSSYISCASGVAHVMNCTFGLVFNPAINLCDWPEKVPECQDAFDFRCPVPHLGEEDMVINYRYPQDPECRYFFSCLNGSYRVLACDEGLLFNHRIGRCVEYDDFICDN